MKILLLFIGLFIANAATALTFNDTIYFNSGETRIVHVTKETKNAITYQYQNFNGGLKSGRTRKSMLFGYAIYDEQQNLVSRHVNEQKKLTEEDHRAEENKVGPGAGVAIVGAGALVGVGVVGGAVLIFAALWELDLLRMIGTI